MFPDKKKIKNKYHIGRYQEFVVSEKSDELHEARSARTYPALYFIKNQEIEGLIFEMENEVCKKYKDKQGGNKKQQCYHEFEW